MTYKQTLEKSLNRINEIVESAFVCTLRDEIGYPLPSWIEISPIDYCNRKCEFCPKCDETIAPNQKNLQMPISVIEKMATELHAWGYRGGITLGGYGEPMYYQNLIPAIHILSRVCRLEIITNGDVLNVENIRDMHRAGMSFFSVSLYDGPHQIETFAEMFEEAGVPAEDVFLRDRWYNPDDQYGLKLTNRAGTVKLEHEEEMPAYSPCYYPCYSMTIDWNGDVYLCPQDWHRKIRMGNVGIESMISVWRNGIYKKYRQQLIDGNRDLFPCQGCNCTGTLHGSRHAEAWREHYDAERSKQRG